MEQITKPAKKYTRAKRSWSLFWYTHNEHSTHHTPPLKRYPDRHTKRTDRNVGHKNYSRPLPSRKKSLRCHGERTVSEGTNTSRQTGTVSSEGRKREGSDVGSTMYGLAPDSLTDMSNAFACTKRETMEEANEPMFKGDPWMAQRLRSGVVFLQGTRRRVLLSLWKHEFLMVTSEAPRIFSRSFDRGLQTMEIEHCRHPSQGWKERKRFKQRLCRRSYSSKMCCPITQRIKDGSYHWFHLERSWVEPSTPRRQIHLQR